MAKRNAKLVIDGTTEWSWEPNDGICDDCFESSLCNALENAAKRLNEEPTDCEECNEEAEGDPCT